VFVHDVNLVFLAGILHATFVAGDLVLTLEHVKPVVEAGTLSRENISRGGIQLMKPSSSTAVLSGEEFSIT
jgi:hypothetical protein